MKVADILDYWEDEEAMHMHHLDHSGFGFDPGEACELCREEAALSELIGVDPFEDYTAYRDFEILEAEHLPFPELFTYRDQPYVTMCTGYNSFRFINIEEVS